MDNVYTVGRANGTPFTTKDRSNDNGTCNSRFHGGWWYGWYVSCGFSDLNRRYGVRDNNSRDMEWRYNRYGVVKRMMMISKY